MTRYYFVSGVIECLVDVRQIIPPRFHMRSFPDRERVTKQLFAASPFPAENRTQMSVIQVVGDSRYLDGSGKSRVEDHENPINALH